MKVYCNTLVHKESTDDDSEAETYMLHKNKLMEQVLMTVKYKQLHSVKTSPLSQSRTKIKLYDT